MSLAQAPTGIESIMKSSQQAESGCRMRASLTDKLESTFEIDFAGEDFQHTITERRRLGTGRINASNGIIASQPCSGSIVVKVVGFQQRGSFVVDRSELSLFKWSKRSRAIAPTRSGSCC